MEWHQNILKDIGEHFGLPLEFDCNKQCMLIFDDNTLISIQVNNEIWLVNGMLMEISPNIGSELWQNLMVVNRELAEQNAGVIGYDASSQVLLYINSITNLSDVNEIISHIEVFINRQEYLQTQLCDYRLY